MPGLVQKKALVGVVVALFFFRACFCSDRCEFDVLGELEGKARFLCLCLVLVSD